MLIALPNKDKSWTCTLFMPMDKFPLIFDNGKEGIVNFFDEYFKDFLEAIKPEDLINQVMNGKARTLITIKVNVFNIYLKFKKKFNFALKIETVQPVPCQ